MVLLAGALTAVVATGAGLLVAAVWDGGTPAALDRAVPSVTAPATRAPARPPQPAPVAAGTLRAAASSPAASPTSPPASTPASRERRSAPVPTTRAAAGATRTGTATFYTLAGLPNCGYPDAAASGTYVALSPADFAGSAACGTVFDVTGPKGTVRVTVADQCPECEAGHLDLAAPAFARIADPVAGIVPVSFTRVVDPPTGPVRIRVKEGSSQYWLALRFDNHGNALTAAEIKVGNGFQRLHHTDYNYWLDDSGAGGGPFTVRLTDTAGHQTTVSGVRLSVASVQRTGVDMYSGAVTAQPATATPARTAASSAPPTSVAPTPSPPPSTDASTPGQNAAEALPVTAPVEAGCKT